MSERTSEYMCLFLTRPFCICRCPVWGAAGGVWRKLCEACWDPETAASDSPSVVTGCTGCARFQGRGWNRLELLTLMVRVQTMLILSRADTPYPERIPTVNCDCTWTAWEMRAQPRITVQKTQQGDLNKSPDINLTVGVIRTCRGHRGLAVVLQ
jgi:hypothetical protein